MARLATAVKPENKITTIAGVQYLNFKTYQGNDNLKGVGVKVVWTHALKDEYDRCAEDPIYFIEKYVKIVSVDDGIIPFKMWPFQRELVTVLHENREVIGKLARQVGKSQTTASYLLWHVLFHGVKSWAILANKDETAREILNQKLQVSYELLPFWLQQGVVKWNEGSIVLENKSRVLTAATSSGGIRGKSLSGLVLDEVAFIPPNIAQQFFESVYPTISSGKTTKIFMLSTPKGFNHFYKFWNEATEKRSGFVPFSIDWWEVPGRDDAWRLKMIGSLGSEEAFDQEYGCEFHGTSGTLISGKFLKEMSYKSPIKLLNDERLAIFEEPIASHQYVMTVDGSEGLGLDYSTFSIFDISALPYQQVARYRNNNISPTFFPDVIVKTARAYNDAMVLCELNSTGKQVADIIWMDYDYDNIAWVGSSEKKGQVLFGGTRETQQPGVKTSKMTKRIGCTSLKDLIENKKLIINDFNSLSELSTFIRKNDTVGWAADEQKNDDMVATLWLFAWMATQEYFRNMNDIDLMSALHAERQQQLDDEVIPFFNLSQLNVAVEETIIDNQGIVWTAVN